MTTSPKRPCVVCADHFHMTNDATSKIKRKARMIWSTAKNEDELLKELHHLQPSVLISEYLPINGQVMDASPNLKGIVVSGAGFDHIDVQAASERGIYVANTRGSNAESVAEHVFALILLLSRKNMVLDSFVRAGKWIAREESLLPAELMARDIRGKVIGLIGLGAIGRVVARIAQCFGMRVLAYDPNVSSRAALRIGAEPATLRRLLAESNFVSLHVPLNKQTKRMIGTNEMQLMKQSAYLINTSRGAVVDEQALIKALESKRISGAALDVFEKEPIDKNNRLLSLSNVIVSPHMAGGSKEALDATALMVSEETIRILENKPPRNLVNKAQLARKAAQKTLRSESAPT